MIELIDNLGISEDHLEKMIKGYLGEKQVREWFVSKGIKFMQVDIMFLHHDKWCLGEIKRQEKFKSPPFDGHGLPKWQIERRLQFYKDTGVLPYLIVLDPDDNCIYIRDLEMLYANEKHPTNGANPRIIFPLKNFKKIPL